MNILNIVNKFCAHNNFLPTQLFGTKEKVIVKYNRDQKGEFISFIKKLSNLNNSGVINTTVSLKDNFVTITAGVR
tara:strand:+ start:6889 stop:7113 length:225 start_codon:yes stop_codon:yes gene_type:complete